MSRTLWALAAVAVLVVILLCLGVVDGPFAPGASSLSPAEAQPHPSGQSTSASAGVARRDVAVEERDTESAGVQIEFRGLEPGAQVDVVCALASGRRVWKKRITSGAPTVHDVPAAESVRFFVMPSQVAPHRRVVIDTVEREVRRVVFEYTNCVRCRFVVEDPPPGNDLPGFTLLYVEPDPSNEKVGSRFRHATMVDGAIDIALDHACFARLEFEGLPLAEIDSGRVQFEMYDGATYVVGFSNRLCAVSALSSGVTTPILAAYADKVGYVFPVDGVVFADSIALSGSRLVIVSRRGWAQIESEDLSNRKHLAVELRNDWLSLEVSCRNNVDPRIAPRLLGPISPAESANSILPGSIRFHRGTTSGGKTRFHPLVPGTFLLVWYVDDVPIHEEPMRIELEKSCSLFVDSPMSRLMTGPIAGFREVCEFLQVQQLAVGRATIRRDDPVFELAAPMSRSAFSIPSSEPSLGISGLPLQVEVLGEDSVLRIHDEASRVTVRCPSLLGGEVRVNVVVPGVYVPHPSLPASGALGARFLCRISDRATFEAWEHVGSIRYFRGRTTVSADSHNVDVEMACPGRWVSLRGVGREIQSRRIAMIVGGDLQFTDLFLTGGSTRRIWVPEQVDGLATTRGRDVVDRLDDWNPIPYHNDIKL